MNTIQDNDNLDFSYYFGVILKRFWLLLLIMTISVSAAVAVNVLMRPVYKTSALMMINREDSGKIDSNTITSWNSDEDYYRTQYKLLESRTLLQQVYDRLSLQDYPEFADPLGWQKLKDRINVSPIPRSRLVTIEVKSFDPVLAAKIANTLSNTFIQNNLNDRISMGQDVIKALESTEASPQEEELLNSMPQVVNSDFIKTLKQQEAQVEGELANLKAKYTNNHPDVISRINQLKALKNKIALETRRLVQSIKIELSGQFSANNIRIIDPAGVPQKVYLPKKMINLAASVLFGFIFGVIIIFIVDFLDQSIKSSDDLEKKLQIPFLGFSPYEKFNKRDSEYGVMLKEGNYLMAENIRNIRTMLNFALKSNNAKSILIASSLQGEGKSNISVNLSVAFAQTGKKVLLVDGDLRRSRLHKLFKLSLEKGLSNLWTDDESKNSFEDNIYHTEVQNLDVMTSGQRPPNPAELLNTPLLDSFVKWAEEKYDLLIIDCPALMPVSDTLLWGRLINKALFVIRYGKTNGNIAKIALERLQHTSIKVLGGVISQYNPGGLTSYRKTYHYYSQEK
ncbi:MAG: polysaccharide biosynthesis tyrosine autokinase [Elusimicrobia bacterium]|nr:polysaccharide biosynthesis tyrosine autokinase [Elusimicrobiota bacterium]